MTNINFWFVGWGVGLILNVLVGVLDYLQDGIAWPINLVTIFGVIVLRYVK